MLTDRLKLCKLLVDYDDLLSAVLTLVLMPLFTAVNQFVGKLFNAKFYRQTNLHLDDLRVSKFAANFN